MSMDKTKEIEEQYDKIYRYCYFKLQKREIAEDLTQETFLRFLESPNYHNEGKALRYLYTIARNLCIDEYRKKKYQILEGGLDEEKTVGVVLNGDCRKGMLGSDMEEKAVMSLTVRGVLLELDEDDRELVLLRYVNEVPVSVICGIYRISRFACYRKLKRVIKMLKEKLESAGLGL